MPGNLIQVDFTGHKRQREGPRLSQGTRSSNPARGKVTADSRVQNPHGASSYVPAVDTQSRGQRLVESFAGVMVLFSLPLACVSLTAILGNILEIWQAAWAWQGFGAALMDGVVGGALLLGVSLFERQISSEARVLGAASGAWIHSSHGGTPS